MSKKAPDLVEAEAATLLDSYVAAQRGEAAAAARRAGTGASLAHSGGKPLE
jgi:hypothetical protein